MRALTDTWLAPGTPHLMAESLAQEFHEVFGRKAQGSWFAPGRANLNGEHVDFHGGRCLPLALEYGTYVAAAAREDGVVRLRTLDATLDTGIIDIPAATVQRLPQVDPNLPSWTSYVLGVLWALQSLEPTSPENPDNPSVQVKRGFGADVLIRSTLPIGGGLSSSASLECSVALAFIALGSDFGAATVGDDFTQALTDDVRATLAAACVRAEVEVVGAGTGGLDQTASFRATSGAVLSLDCRDFSLQRLNVSSLEREYRFFAVDTAHPHQLADGEFSARRAESEYAAEILGVRQLRDAFGERIRPKDVQKILAEYDQRIAEQPPLPPTGSFDEPTNSAQKPVDTDAARRRLKHALTEMLRSEMIHTLLKNQAHGTDAIATALGEHMLAGHHSMKREAEVSFALADQVVKTATVAGATGARLIGGGFGGSVLVLAPLDALAAITAACAKLSPDIRFLKVSPSAPARSLL